MSSVTLSLEEYNALLADAINWRERGKFLVPVVETRECLHCKCKFDVGVRTGRRADAKFCSHEHQIAYNSHKRRTSKIKS